ncbi:MAG TPA: hypothetical protein PLN83_08905 [Syntrophorhabdus sp.]|nr:hypothetical protein [Syntrophorhabdus sp.]
MLWDGIDEQYRFSVFVTNLDLPAQMVLHEEKQSTLKTPRFRCFASGVRMKKYSRQNILKIALAREKRAWLDGLSDITRSARPLYRCFNA